MIGDLVVKKCQKWSCTWKFAGCWPAPLQKADFLSIFACSASAITPSEKKVYLTLIGSPLRAFQWA